MPRHASPRSAAARYRFPSPKLASATPMPAQTDRSRNYAATCKPPECGSSLPLSLPEARFGNTNARPDRQIEKLCRDMQTPGVRQLATAFPPRSSLRQHQCPPRQTDREIMPRHANPRSAAARYRFPSPKLASATPMPAQTDRSRNYAATCKPPECGSSLPLSLPEARFGNTNARPDRQIEKLCRDMQNPGVRQLATAFPPRSSLRQHQCPPRQADREIMPRHANPRSAAARYRFPSPKLASATPMPAQTDRSRNYAATCKTPECGSSLPLSLPEARFGNTNARPGRQIEKLCRDMQTPGVRQLATAFPPRSSLRQHQCPPRQTDREIMPRHANPRSAAARYRFPSPKLASATPMPAQPGRSRNYAATCKPPECGSSLPLSLPEARFGNTNARPGRQIEKLCRDMQTPGVRQLATAFPPRSSLRQHQCPPSQADR